MNKIEEAAKRLLARGEITQAEYDSLEKTGGIFGPGYYAGPAITKGLKDTANVVRLVGIPLAALIAAGAMAKEQFIDPALANKKIDESFDLMSVKVPQLAEKDQDQIRDYFDVIKTYSPRAAANPLVAGALVNKMMEFGGVDHKLVQDIANIESNKEKPTMTSRMLDTASKILSAKPD